MLEEADGASKLASCVSSRQKQMRLAAKEIAKMDCALDEAKKLLKEWMSTDILDSEDLKERTNDWLKA